MIDAHIHLDQYALTKMDEYVETWQRHGVTAVVAVSTNLASAYRTLELQQRYPDFVLAGVGYHPEQPLPTSQELDELIRLLSVERRHIAAIGEVGLPHYALAKLGVTSLDPYLELLEQFIAISIQEDLPIVLHAVHDKAAIVLELLQQARATKAHFHWLKAPAQVVSSIVSEGYYISVTPEVCYRTRDQELAKLVPLDQLLLETDGPWPFAGPFCGVETNPVFLASSAVAVAKEKATTAQTVLAITQANARRLYAE